MDETNRTTMILLASVVVLTAIVLVLAWRDHSLARRVVELEQRIDAVEGQGAAAGRARRPGRGSGGEVGAFLRGEDGAKRRGARGQAAGSAGIGVDPDDLGMAGVLESAEARDVIEDVVAEHSEAERASRRERREETMTQRIREVIDTFSTEHDLDDETTQQLGDELESTALAMMSLRSAQYDGELDAEESREQRQQLRDASDARVLELLGDELNEALQEQMQGGRRGPY
jgi:hypothetical protein